MRKRAERIAILAEYGLLAIAVGAGTWSLPAKVAGGNATSSGGELNVHIAEWSVPTKGAHPHDPAVGTDGALWFTEQMVNKIGRLDPATGEFKEYPLKVEIPGLTDWWRTGKATSGSRGISPATSESSVRFDPKTETFAKATIPSGGKTVRNMAATKDGRIYLACSGVDKMGVVTQK